ncbi:hypothetical protein [Hymenobacter siberiensis]|uniref:hypothetical protein n=1 Tax=Hymenobacter siberiensis TaxID=2848396 RepID=UPI001C1DF830|nr:hypothetical protein [Hymenobacter siberiensis]MBU6119496.1 hypothetical protein [Hymenobacter siberiensis]
MRKIIVPTIKAFSLCIALVACGHSTASAPPNQKSKDPNAGKHQLAKNDPRTWQTYPVVVLVATKYRIGVDTTAQLIRSFEERFNGLGQDTFLSGMETLLPVTYNRYEENTATAVDDSAFFLEQSKRFGLPPSLIASLIIDFYTIGGSNRTYPESSSQ